jgi:hypothetical protein
MSCPAAYDWANAMGGLRSDRVCRRCLCVLSRSAHCSEVVTTVNVMRRISSLSLLLLAFAASALAAAPDGRPQPLTKAPFPTYTNRAENPEVWNGIAEALRKAGLPNAIAVIRVRESGVWSAHVDLQPMSGRPRLRAVVSFDLNSWKVLCFTSEVQDCSKYGR